MSFLTCGHLQKMVVSKLKQVSYNYRVMHQICNWTEYHKFTFYALIFEQMKIQTFSAPQNDRLNLIFVKDINISVHILISSKITT